MIFHLDKPKSLFSKDDLFQVPVERSQRFFIFFFILFRHYLPLENNQAEASSHWGNSSKYLEYSIETLHCDTFFEQTKMAQWLWYGVLLKLY